MARDRLDDDLADLGARSAASRAGEGASSSTFWWRRCSEQSRSPRWHDVAVAVGDDLDLDVARLLEVALHVDRVVAEGGLGLGLGGRDGLDQVVRGLGDLHAAPAAAGGGLDQHREADRLRRPRWPPRRSSTAPSEPGTTGMPASFTVCLAVILSPIMRMCSGLGPMKVKPWALDDLGEAGVLRQEAVAGVDRLGAGDLAGGDDRGDVQVALGRRGGADADALVGQPHPHGAGVGLGVHGDGGDAHLLAGAVDAERDLAPVGDEDLVEHRRYSMNDEGLAELDRLGVADQDLDDRAGAWARGSGSWSSWPR